jgi:Hypervirulence associated proteins TUDOR domain
MNKLYELAFYNSILDMLQKAKAGSVKRGDSVSWNSSGGTARGKITRIITSGEADIPGSSFKITGTKDDPGALIRVYRKDNNGKYKPTDTIVGHKVSTLTKIEAL